MCKRLVENANKRRYLFSAIRSPIPAAQEWQTEYIQSINPPDFPGGFIDFIEKKDVNTIVTNCALNGLKPGNCGGIPARLLYNRGNSG